MFIWDSLFVVLILLSGRTCFNPLVKECSMPHRFSKKNKIIFNQGRNCGSSITMKNYRWPKPLTHIQKMSEYGHMCERLCVLIRPNWLARAVPGNGQVEFSALLRTGMHFTNVHSWFSCSPVNHTLVSAPQSPDFVFYITFPARGWRVNARETVLNASFWGGIVSALVLPFPCQASQKHPAPSLGGSSEQPTNNHRPSSLP